MLRMLGVAAFTFVLTTVAHAARVPEFTESFRIQRPDPSFTRFGSQVAIDGDWAMIRAERITEDPEYGTVHDSAVFLYRRQTTGWVLQRQLGPWMEVTEWANYGLAMNNGIAAVYPGARGAMFFELIGDDWVQQGPEVSLAGGDLEISGGRLLSDSDSCEWSGGIFEEDSANAWRLTALLPGYPGYCGDNAATSPRDLSGNHAIIANLQVEGEDPSLPLARLFRYANGSWQLDAELPHETRLAWPTYVAVRGNHAFMTGVTHRGARVFQRVGPNQWPMIGRLDTVDSYDNFAQDIEQNEFYVMQQAFVPERGGHVINVFRPSAAGGYYHAAILSRSDGWSMGTSFDISGRRVITGTDERSVQDPGGVHIFELPATLPVPRATWQDSFEAGNAGSLWTPSAGSTFSIATVNGQRVYRQASTAGEAASFTHARGALGDQSIQAEITPRAFARSDDWAGLATRQTDMNNYYYVTLRSGTNRIELKRKVNGAFTTLDSQTLAVAPNQAYRVRLQSIGPRHQVYVNDTPVLAAVDRSLARGVPGVIMYKAAADYDNVIVTQSHLTNIREDWFDVFEDNFSPGWDLTGRGRWFNNEANPILGQDDDTVEARAITGSPADEQIVKVDVRVNSWGPGSAFAGVLLRYVDDANYVYAILRADNRLSLRQLVNGQPQVIAETAVPVQLNRWYELRVEMVAGVTRVFLDGVQRLSAGDVGGARGRVGVMTNRAGAWFDEFHAYQP